MKYANHIKQIEIDSLWSGKKHILWTLDPHVNILSGINGVGKSTILNKVFRSVSTNGDLVNHLLKGVHITVEPEDATHIRFDIIRSLDSPVLDSETMNMVDSRIRSALDFQLYHLQRKYLDYQVNIGNRIISALQQGHTEEAQLLSESKKRFQDMVDDLFEETGKKIVRTENEIRFSQIGETLVAYQLSSGEADTGHTADGAGGGPAAVCAVHGRAGGQSAYRMAETAHRPHRRVESQCADYSDHPLASRHHERMAGQGDGSE